MADFDEAFAPLEPKNTARQTLFGVKVNSTRDVVLIGKHAGALNDRFQALATKQAKKHAAELAGDDSPERRALSQRLFAELLGKTVITGWENVCERDGTATPFSVDACLAFLTALAKRRPDIAGPRGSIDLFFANPANFADGYDIADTEALGKA